MTLTLVLPYLSRIIEVASWPVTAFFAYRLGLRSQTVAAKREAKFAALSANDQVRLDILACRYLPHIVAQAQSRIKTPVFNFSARVPKRRGRIEAAWQAYQCIGDYDFCPDNPAFRDAQPAAEMARPLLLEPLAKLREEVDDA